MTRYVAPSVLDRMSKPVQFKEKSCNGKLAPVTYETVANTKRKRPVPVGPFVSTTALPIEQTCPPSCRFFERTPSGQRPCYADAGWTKFSVRALEETAAKLNWTPEAIANEEALIIGKVFRKGIPQDGGRDGKSGRDLRLHVFGDARTTEAAKVISNAAQLGWKGRGGGAVWGYTHAWRDVPRVAWAGVSMLASVETGAEAKQARRRGYAPAIVVPDFATDRAHMYDGIRILPCVAETHETTCIECRLCLDRDLLNMDIAIAFKAHGTGAAEVRRRLTVIR